MHYSTQMNPVRARHWNRAAMFRLAGIACFLLPALCPAQTPPAYTINTIAGGAGTSPPSFGYSGDTGPATSADLNGPIGVALDSKGNLYITDQANNVIRLVTASTGVITTFAGEQSAGFSGDAGLATSAQLNFPFTVVLDSKGNVYISDTKNGVVRIVAPSLIISTIAGSSVNNGLFSGDGGLATQSGMSDPSGLAVDSAGNMYIVDGGNYRIRMVTASTGDISTIAGDGTGGEGEFCCDGPAGLAHLGGPGPLALDASGNLYYADSVNNEIRKLSLSGGQWVITRIAGSPTGMYGFGGDGGLATNALLANPSGVAVDKAGNVYISDTDNDLIRMITPDGIIHTIAGTTTSTGQIPYPGWSGDGGPALSAQLFEPTGLFVDGSGNLYIADYGNNVIRELTPNTALGVPAPAPAITGVVSASAFGELASLAPGSWIEIYGSNLAPTTRLWCVGASPPTCPASDFTGINAPTSLNSTYVTVGGQAAFVEYISPTQIDAQVAGTVGLGTQPVTVSTSAGTSAAVNVNINFEEPALYAPTVFKILGKQYVGALFTDGVTYVFPPDSFAGINSRAAQPGDTIVIYGIGFGAVPGNPPGQIPQAANGLTLPIIPKFYFGGVQAQVSFAGLSPQFMGLYQFNVIVPAIAANNAVPLTFTVNIGGTDVAGTQTLYTAVQ